MPGTFDGATPAASDGCEARLLYPLDGAAIPDSFIAPDIQGSAGSANAFRLRLTSSLTTLTVTPSFTPTSVQWAGLTRFDPGVDVQIELTAGTLSGSTVTAACRAATSTEVEVTDGGINGTIVYGAPPATKALSFDANETPLHASIRLPGALCHGCHTVNLARPTRMAYGPDIPGRTHLVDLGSPGTILRSCGGARCSLYTQTWNAATHRFGNETLIASPGPNETLYYPTVSSDSQWVAYNRAEQWTHADGELQSSNANPRATLVLVAAVGGAQRLLTDANGAGDLTHSWPRWAPTAGDYPWLA